jgi:hypothetical protein
MSRHELMEEGMEYLNDIFELDISTPYIVIGFGIVILIVNGFILYELSKMMHGHKGSYGVWSIFYYVFEVLNYVVGYKFISVLIKQYNRTQNKLKMYLAFVITVINPLLFSLLFY